MTTKQLENRIEKFFSVANELQNRALTMGKQGFHQALQREIAARKLATNIFAEGLSLLGKGLVLGRKAKESFSASTNKKSSRLQNMVAPTLGSNEKSTSVEVDSKPFHGVEVKHKKAVKNLDRKSSATKRMNPRNKKARIHTGPVARSH